MNGSAGGGGGLAQDEEMPEQHELGEELAFTGRWVVWVNMGKANFNTNSLKFWQRGRIMWLPDEHFED